MTEVNVLSTNFSLKGLLKYTFPSIALMIFMSLYTIIDGIFVSKLVGEDALASINFIVPTFTFAAALALMFSVGGSAVVSKFMGEGKDKEAKQFFTTLFLVVLLVSILYTTGIVIFSEQVLEFLNVSTLLHDYSRNYLLSLSIFFVPIFLQMYFITFLNVAGKPNLALILTIIGGIANIILDFFLISPNFMNLGIVGAGIATGIGNGIPGIVGVIYFYFNKKGTLYFVKPKLDFKILVQSMFNGSSELVANISVSITTIMFNIILLKLASESGVAAVSAVLYIQMLQNAIFIGFTMGVAPIIGYKFGENVEGTLKKLVSQCYKIIFTTSIIIVLVTFVFSEQAVSFFIDKDSDTFLFTLEGLRLFLPAYLFSGINMMTSSLFTALSNGKVSAIVAFSRTLVFLVIFLLVLPALLGVIGVWISVPVAELCSLVVSVYFYRKYKNIYKY